MRRITQSDCDRIAYKLNTRPCKRLGFKTPYEVYYQTTSPLYFEFELIAIFPSICSSNLI